MPLQNRFVANACRVCLYLEICLLPVAVAAADQAPAAERPEQAELGRFIDRIWSESPAIDAARAAVDMARARRQGAGLALYNPALVLDAERTDVNTVSIGIDQTIDWGDKRASQSAVARAELAVAEAELAATRQRLAVEALNALVRYQTARDMQALAVSRTRLMKHFLATVQQRYRAGDMHALDASLARLAYSEALMQQAAADSELASGEADLQAVSGLMLPAWPSLSPAMLPQPGGDGSGQSSLSRRLPALRALQRQQQAARGRIDLARGMASADPTIGIRGGRDGSSTQIGLSLEIPLFVRNDFRHDIDASRAAAVQVEGRFRDALQRARARLAGSLGRFRNMTDAWRSWLASGRQAHVEQASLLDQLWRAGELTASDYLIQAKQNVETQAAATRLYGEVWQAAIAWLDDAGEVGDWLGRERQTMNSGERAQ